VVRNANGTPSSKVPARPTRNPYTAAEWPCVFNGNFVREQVDPRIKEEWEARREDKPKFGDLRNTFRREHCRNVNPWGSSTCPFKEEDCALAFLRGVTQSLAARNAHGYFIKVARSSGAARADEAVEQRARMRTDVDPRAMGGSARAGLRERPALGVGEDRRGGPADMEPVPQGPEAGVRSPFTRPGSIRDVLGSFDLRPRPLPDHDADEGTR
jgi:hypothetical protein